MADIAVWAVPFGLVGGRLYHVITDYELYFSEGRDWVDAFKIWEGGLGIWGAIALGAVGAWIGCRRRGIPLPAYADALAPGIALAQAIGRWGNWFNQELYGKPTDLPWALKITSRRHGPGRRAPTTRPSCTSRLWCIGVALLVIWADRRFKLGHGRAFALYVAAYCAGRALDRVHARRRGAPHPGPAAERLDRDRSSSSSPWSTSCSRRKKRPGREEVVEPGALAEGADGAAAEDADDADDAGLGREAGRRRAEDDEETDAGETVRRPTAPSRDGRVRRREARDARRPSSAADAKPPGAAAPRSPEAAAGCRRRRADPIVGSARRGAVRPGAAGQRRRSASARVRWAAATTAASTKRPSGRASAPALRRPPPRRSPRAASISSAVGR